MKKIIISSLFLIITYVAFTQDFDKAIATARSSYSSGKLEEAHFALQQAMQEVDLIIGSEVLKLLPAKMEDRSINTSSDNVTTNIGFVGTTIHRSYGPVGQLAELDIISNSPLIASLNMLLNAPLVGGLMNDANNKTVKVQGYKGRLSANVRGDESGKKDYEIQIPIGGALITFRVSDTNETKILAMANTIPMQQIAKLIQ
jgi:hypothetical protein